GKTFNIIIYPCHSYDSFFNKHSTPVGIKDGAWLLIDLLHHKMIIPSFFYLLQVKLQLLHIRIYARIIFNLSYFDVLTKTYNRHFTIFKIDGIAGKLNKW